MPIREEIVTSAVNFLQDPNVAASPVENKLSFLRSKNLTQEEIDVSLARVGIAPPGQPVAAPSQAVAGPVQQQQQPYYNSSYPSAPPYGWQPPPPAPPKRDWRDWFIMATVVGGVGYGLYSISKRYIYPLVAPPTPEKLEQDKATVDEQFEKAFATLEQLSKDTESLKASELDRTEKLDKILIELEEFMTETKSGKRRQEDETDRLRSEVESLKDAIPKSMTANKDFTDERLREIANEVKSLKSLIGQRMSSAPASSNSTTSNNYLQSAKSNAPPAPTATPANEPETKSNGEAKEGTNGDTPAAGRQDYLSSLGGRSSPFASGMPAGKAAIPAWQLAMANQGPSDADNTSQQGASSSS
ncbi:hypothetical protein PG996_013177 [Apiospora saccharicola]|uniref:Peroxisomal membrane protein PEX14 n=1 Tax=Apiospora saccharicola TaxID=335842 RepID=A0ABR1U4P9_9PEZI